MRALGSVGMVHSSGVGGHRVAHGGIVIISLYVWGGILKLIRPLKAPLNKQNDTAVPTFNHFTTQIRLIIQYWTIKNCFAKDK